EKGRQDSDLLSRYSSSPCSGAYFGPPAFVLTRNVRGTQMFLCVFRSHGLDGRGDHGGRAGGMKQRCVHRQAPAKAGDSACADAPSKTFMASFGGA
ncbi:hypothetical protein GMDG_05904, partial [Pseudogymnoascus destructans 20631-21]